MRNMSSRRRISKNRAVLASIGLHLLFAIIVALMLSHQRGVYEDAYHVELFKVNRSTANLDVRPPRRPHVPPTLPIEQPVLPQFAPNALNKIPIYQTDVTPRPPALELNSDVLNPADVPVPSVKTGTAQPAVSSTPTPPVKRYSTAPRIKSTASLQRGGASTEPSNRLQAFLESTLPSTDLATRFDTSFSVKVPKGQLGGILEGRGKEIRGYIRLIRLKHSLSDWWQDPTAIPALIKWIEKHTTIRADISFEGGALRLTDRDILDAPLIIMTGHDRDITVGRGLAKDGPLNGGFTPAERSALRKYIVEKGGTLFFDDCGFNGLFANIVADELNQIFPEYPLEILPHQHELYRSYYHLSKPPDGGDVFWGNENNAEPTQFRYQKAIIIENRVAVLYNRKDYLCAMETAEIESRTMLRLRRSNDVYRFMCNLLVYAMKYGGNTDRTRYQHTR